MSSLALMLLCKLEPMGSCRAQYACTRGLAVSLIGVALCGDITLLPKGAFCGLGGDRGGVPAEATRARCSDAVGDSVLPY
jgi:hypothetical protein